MVWLWPSSPRPFFDSPVFLINPHSSLNLTCATGSSLLATILYEVSPPADNGATPVVLLVLDVGEVISAPVPALHHLGAASSCNSWASRI
ncbi:hypothetical protein Cob_v006991 [Colletotrichum orbiculare MAFF 240422]|uniref:Uncharacterized protein n=1 Tax=Colletotrichum orbiculare (strain 104-T / ATCC 96160 / CBS 514.97 / LARS 414 / MAFF 240422) TaxID=1213857 RepID=A0A484FT30_COLOR|nr:hypothetical protein Cob_v006991 [Colletotrichum orbiculare MAFF 240422]